MRIVKHLLLFSTIFLVACSNDDPSVEEVDQTANELSEGEVVDATEYENGHLLVDGDWLEENKEDVVVIDVRSEGYDGGHIPGAIHFNPDNLSDPDNPVGGVLPDEEKFQQLMRSAGINDDSTVVVYDGGNSLWSARLFYGLELYGHEDVRILNGGFTAWLSDEKEISTEEPSVEEGSFTATLNPALQSSQEDVENQIGNEETVLLDTRSEGEYDGSEVRAERGGHIPGAPNLEWSEAVASDGVPYFKDPEVLEKQFAAIGVDRDKTIIPYCQTNVRGAHSYFSLRLLGFNDIKPYEGSWSEYGNDPDVEIES